MFVVDDTCQVFTSYYIFVLIKKLVIFTSNIRAVSLNDKISIFDEIKSKVVSYDINTEKRDVKE